MSKVAIVNFEIYQGATFREGFTYKNRFKKPHDLTGYGARMQIRTADGEIVASLSTTENSITLGGVNGTIDLFIPDELTAQMTFTKASYDLFLDAANGDSFPILAGSVTFTKGQTRHE